MEGAPPASIPIFSQPPSEEGAPSERTHESVGGHEDPTVRPETPGFTLYGSAPEPTPSLYPPPAIPSEMNNRNPIETMNEIYRIIYTMSLRIERITDRVDDMDICLMNTRNEVGELFQLADGIESNTFASAQRLGVTPQDTPAPGRRASRLSGITPINFGSGPTVQSHPTGGTG